MDDHVIHRTAGVATTGTHLCSELCGTVFARMKKVWEVDSD